MLKRILIGACCTSLTLGIACKSDPNEGDEGARPVAGASPESSAQGPTTQKGPTDASPEKGSTNASSRGVEVPRTWPAVDAAPVEAAESSVEFAENAFPPLLPADELHARPWLRDDCLLCHEDGSSDAPSVQHSGMPDILLGARCRSCHLAADPDAPPEGGVEFRYNAFPPTLPIDDDHRGAWLRDDCLECHDIGLDGAPKLEHKGMANGLLQARCRSCHVPRANSVELDLIE